MKIHEIISEDIIEPSSTPGTMSLWHGGNLELESNRHKTGRVEYGPGLYLITNYSVAKKYAKGSRKLYMITIEKGKSASETLIPLQNIENFVSTNVQKSKRNDVLDRLKRLSRDNINIHAQYLINVCINEDAIRASNMDNMRTFLVQNGCDYEVVPNPFGWNDALMIVLFNMNKIVDKKVIKPNDKITEFDLPARFN